MASKSKRRRKVLGASCILAALIIAGSSFAWFTSKDEVTNRLSANAEYGVAIAENFQPPENWVPGQEINKDASAVNTGNVDAFARMSLGGDMRLLQKQTTANDSAKWGTSGFGTASTASTALNGVTNVADTELTGLGLTKLSSDGQTYFKTLDKTQTINPQTSASGNQYGYAGATSGPYSEVQAMQSGILAYAPANAQYSYVLKEDTELPIYVKKVTTTSSSTTGPALENVVVPAGTLVMVAPDATAQEGNKPATITDGVLSVTKTTTDKVTVTSTSGSTKEYDKVVYVPNSTTATTSLKNVEFESFTPMTDGLYLFLRNESGVDLKDNSNVEFSGYYMQGYSSAAADGAKYNAADFYALNTNGTASDYAVKGALPAKKTTDGDNDTGTGSPSYAKPITVTLVDGNITAVEPSAHLELYNAMYQTLGADALDWYVVKAGTPAVTDYTKIYAVYNKTKLSSGTSADDFDKNTDIVVEITLDNVGAYSAAGDEEKWTPIGGTDVAADYSQYKLGDKTLNVDASTVKYYYNNDVEEGDTTSKLVDKVKLYDGVTNNAYLAFDFDLNVHLDSVQVTFNEDGTESDRAIKSGEGQSWIGSSAGDGGATGAATMSGKEINGITWTAQTT